MKHERLISVVIALITAIAFLVGLATEDFKLTVISLFAWPIVWSMIGSEKNDA